MQRTLRVEKVTAAYFGLFQLNTKITTVPSDETYEKRYRCQHGKN